MSKEVQYVARLLEYQGKTLFKRKGIPVPEGRFVQSLDEAMRVVDELDFPVAVKGQVLTGGRGKMGAILFAEDKGALSRAVKELLGKEIQGSPVEGLLIEQKVEIRKELYMAVTADPSTRQPVGIFSSKGGVDIEEAAEREAAAMFTVPIDILRGFYYYDAMNLLRQAGDLESREMLQLANLFTRLYEVYREYDCKLAEINPLALTDQGAMALDARADIDDDAVARQTSLDIDVAEEAGERTATRLEIAAATIDENDHRGTVHFVQIDPNGSYARSAGKKSVGFDAIGAGTGLTIMDELVPLGYYPINFCDSSGNPVGSKFYRITKVIMSQPQIEGYLFVSCVSSQQLDNAARGLIKAFKELYPASGGQPNIPCIVQFRGGWDDVAMYLFREHGISQGRWIEVLGRDTTEKEAAEIFDALYKEWKKETGGLQ
ncbi:MAG TPA: ATP-grasp domain-containing protein [Anaerolineae bacterium]|nr:ATP-grasp domain-containing protein [Anaerolineae bacterium]